MGECSLKKLKMINFHSLTSCTWGAKAEKYYLQSAIKNTAVFAVNISLAKMKCLDVMVSSTSTSVIIISLINGKSSMPVEVGGNRCTFWQTVTSLHCLLQTLCAFKVSTTLDSLVGRYRSILMQTSIISKANHI